MMKLWHFLKTGKTARELYLEEDLNKLRLSYESRIIAYENLLWALGLKPEVFQDVVDIHQCEGVVCMDCWKAAKLNASR